MEKQRGCWWSRMASFFLILLPIMLVSLTFETKSAGATSPKLVRHCYGQDRVGLGETSANVTLCANPSDGDLILIQLVANGGPFDIDTLPIAPPAGYQQIRADYFNASGHGYGAMAEFYHIWHTGDPTAVTFSFFTPVAPNWSISEWSGR